MQKSILGGALKNAIVGQTVKVWLHGVFASLMPLTVVEKGQTSGKVPGVRIKAANDTGTVFVVSTAEAEKVRAIEVNGEMYNSDEETFRSELGRLYQPNTEMQSILHEMITPYLEQGNPSAIRNVVFRISSPEAHLNGDFNFVTANKVKGRGKQVAMQLRSASDPNATTVSLWSIRDSGMVQNIQVVMPPVSQEQQHSQQEQV